MTGVFSKHDATNVIAEIPGVGIIIAAGVTVPADGVAGYAPGCLFIQTDGNSATTVQFANIGSVTSANFNYVTVAPD